MSLYIRGKLTGKEVLAKLQLNFNNCGLNIDSIINLSLTEPAGWLTLEKLFAAENEFVPKVLERADVSTVDFGSGTVKITGYQNYEIVMKSIRPLDEGYKFANTAKKFAIINEIFGEIDNCETYLDIGSNLGLYVFLAEMNYGWQSSGVDYNEEYINISKNVAQAFCLNATFRSEKFGDIDNQYDITSLFAIVHHLYARTEGEVGLEKICDKLAFITKKICVIEFPNENDSKGRKWAALSRGHGIYSEANFLRQMKKYFPVVKRFNGVVPSRPFYVFRKH